MTVQATTSSSTENLQALQDKQPKRLSCDIVDQEGRLMLKNLTKTGLLEWVALRGPIFAPAAQSATPAVQLLPFDQRQHAACR